MSSGNIEEKIPPLNRREETSQEKYLNFRIWLIPHYLRSAHGIGSFCLLFASLIFFRELLEIIYILCIILLSRP